MDSFTALLRRASTSTTSPALSPTAVNLIIALLSLIILGLLALTALYILKRVRTRRASTSLPQYNTKAFSPSKSSARSGSHLTIHNSATGSSHRSSSIYIYDEKTSILSAASSAPASVPEIRITFPDEQDEAGRPRSGRVVVVRVAEHGYGLEPLHNGEKEQLPRYEKEEGRWTSVDLERIGGLKEREAGWA